jgi:SNF2 family DNA or RNA helicase
MPGAPTLTRVGDELVLDLSTAGRGAAFNDALRKVRDFEAKRFDWDSKLWHFPDEPMVADRILRTLQPQAEPELLEWIRSSRQRAEEEVTTPIASDAEVLVPWGNQRMPWQPKKVNDLEFTGLFDFQRAAVAHIAKNLRAILADDMGLGKTIEAISTVEEYRLRNRLVDGTLPDGPKLIVAPKSVKGAWLRELGRWLEPDTYGVQMIDAVDPEKRHQQIASGIRDNAWLIANWESLRTEHVMVTVKHRNGLQSREKRIKLKEPLFQVPWAAYLDLKLVDIDPRFVDRLKAKKDKVETGKWLALIADEIHRAKNPRAKQTKGLHRTEAELMMGLTGTPVMNAPSELWSLLHWLWPYEFSDHGRFEAAYEDSYEEDYGNRKGKVVVGVKNPDGLRYAIRGRVIRRTTREIMGDKIPGHRRIYVEVPLHPKQAKAYKDAEKEMWLKVEKEIDEGDAKALQFAEALLRGDTYAVTRIPNGGARTVQLRKILENLALVGGPDVSAAMDEFEERFAGSRPEPWVVYTAFRDSAHLLANRIRKAHKIDVGVYTGDQSGMERTRMEDRFQAGDLDLIVGTTAALKEGITLTRANRGYFLSRDWVPAVDEQAERRYADRTGQSRFSTTYIPQAPDTVATTKVEPSARLKDKIVRAIHSKDNIEEVHE